MSELFWNPERLADYVGGHRDDADAAEAIAAHLPLLRVPRADWGEVDFAERLHHRWDGELDRTGLGLGRLRRRLGEETELLRRAALDFVEGDGAAAGRLRELAVEPDSTPSQQPNERLADGWALLTGLAADAGLPRLPAEPADRDSPGSEELMSCRVEHMATLERAEALLRDNGQLDFTAPSQYLRQLAEVRPGTVGGRADSLATLSSYLDEMLARRRADVARLRQQLRGHTGEAFGDHARTTAGALRATAGDLDRLSGEAEALWRLLDGLLHDVAEAIWGRVEAVGESRIARIGAAVELVEDVNGFTARPEAALWGGLSEDEVDAALELLYKRVWYLAEAMATVVATAGTEAAARLAGEDRDED